MLDSLIHRQDGDIAGICESAMPVERGQIPKDLGVPVGVEENTLQEVGARKLESGLGNGLRLVVQQCFCFVTQQALYVHVVLQSRCPPVVSSETSDAL